MRTENNIDTAEIALSQALDEAIAEAQKILTNAEIVRELRFAAGVLESQD